MLKKRTRAETAHTLGKGGALPISETSAPDEKALRILNLLFALNTSKTPLATEQILSDSDLGYGSDNRESDRRKFQRDRESLAEHGIMVREVRAEGMAETEESSWEIDRRRTHAERGSLSPDDAELVLAAIDETFELHADNPERWPLQRAYLKLKELMGIEASAAPEHDGARGYSPVLQTIWDAFMARRPARFVYRSADGSERAREVELYGTFARGNHSYLVGLDRGAGGMRTFRTDRIVRARHTPASAGTYDVPVEFDIEDYQFLPFDFSDAEPVDAVFMFPANVDEHELELLTRRRGTLTSETDAWRWEIAVRDLDAAAVFCLGHTSLGMRPVSPRALIEAWRANIEKAATAHGESRC